MICQLCQDQVDLSIFLTTQATPGPLAHVSGAPLRHTLEECFCFPPEPIWPEEPGSPKPRYFTLPAATLGAYCIR